MKKLRFLSLFLAFAIFTIPTGLADVIGPKLHSQLKNERTYQHIKTGLERNIDLCLDSATTPNSEELLLTLFGAYCLIVADHTHWAPIVSYSASIPGLKRAKMPKGIGKTFEFQQKIREKLRCRISRASIVTWSYAGRHYLCNPDIVYERLPKKYRQKSLDLVKILPSFAPTSRHAKSD